MTEGYQLVANRLPLNCNLNISPELLSIPGNVEELSDDDFAVAIEELSVARQIALEGGGECTAEHAGQAAFAISVLGVWIRTDELLLQRSIMLADGRINDLRLINDIVLDLKAQSETLVYWGCRDYYLKVMEKFNEVKARQEIIKAQFHANMEIYGHRIASQSQELQVLFDQLLKLRIKYDSEIPGSIVTALDIAAKHNEFLSKYRDINPEGLFDVTIDVYNVQYNFYEWGERLQNLKRSADNTANLPAEPFVDRYEKLELPRPKKSHFTFDPDQRSLVDSDWPATVVVPEVLHAIKAITSTYSAGLLPPMPFRVFVDPERILQGGPEVYRSIFHAYGTAVEFMVTGPLDMENSAKFFPPSEEDWARAYKIVKSHKPSFIAPMTFPSRLYADWRALTPLEKPSDIDALISFSESWNG